MKTLKVLSITLVAAILLITACKKDIEINFPADHNSKVFIEGMLYPGKKPQIFISKSNSFLVQKSHLNRFLQGVLL